MMRFIQVGIRSYKTISSRLTAGITIIILLCSGILANMTFAQLSLKPDPSVIHNSTTTLPSQQQPHEIKITSPTKGQQVQAGKGLVISGISAGNTTSGCRVSVIVNGIKPYQNATPTGSRGPDDYSKWSFMFTPKYTHFKEGQNKITAKFSCGNDPRSVSHNSVNVTGVSTNTTVTSIANNNQHQLQLHQNQQSLPIQTKGLERNFTSANASSTKSSVAPLSNGSSYSGDEKNNTIRTLSVSIHVGKKTIHPGHKQTIILKITDTNTTNAIAGAKVTGNIMDPSGSSKKKLDGVTDISGETSYSWTVGQNDSIGRYKVDMQVSASGYENNIASKSFKVTPIPVSSSNSNNDDDNSLQLNAGNSDTNKNNNNDNYNHPSTIISIPHIQIPEIRIPFHLPFH
ncbi:MAG: hypothetical protein WBF33_00645 [Candidatus Nitrosopolaris sp.]